MRTTTRVFFFGFIGFLIFASFPDPSRGDRTGSEGVVWLSMSPELRNMYTTAYVQGFNSGYDLGCENGTLTARPSGRGFENDPVHVCNGKALTFGNTTKITESVTEFFKRYPGDRYLYIEDIINALGREMTLEEIHKHATPIGITRPR